MPLRGAENSQSTESLAAQFHWALALSALTALAVGPLDALLNLLTVPLGDGPPGPPDPTRANMTLSAGFILTVFCFAGLLTAFLSVLLMCRRWPWPFQRITLFLAALPFAVLLKSAIGNFGLAEFGGPAARACYIAVVALTMAVLVYLGARGPGVYPALARRMAWCLPALSLAALAFVFQWMNPPSLAVSAVVWASILAAAILSYRSASAITLRAATAIAVCGVVVAGGLGLLALPARSRGSQSVAGSPTGDRNVILISIDTLRADRLGAYGANPSKTPNIDLLAADGMVFENAYSPAPWTLPGVASFLTGMNPVASGADCRPPSCSLSNSVVTLAEHFRDAGYRTAAFGSNFNISRRNLLQGFGEYRFGPFEVLPQYSPGALLLWRILPAWFGDDDTSRSIADGAIDWLERNNSDRFFLWVHFLDPHVPDSAPPPDLETNATARLMMRRSAELPYLNRDGKEFPPDWIETIKTLYELETVDVDKQIGRFVDHLRELDLYDDAVILLTADHGEELWDHGRYEHGHALYDELLRVPLIVKAPSVLPGKASVRVATMQTPRTVAEAAGIETEEAYWAPSLPHSADGHDGTLLIGATLYSDRQVGVIFGKRKYIRNSDAGSELLFDLAADPKEQHPLTDQQSLDEARQLLEEQLQRSMELRTLFGDETPPPDSIPPDLLRSLGYL